LSVGDVGHTKLIFNLQFNAVYTLILKKSTFRYPLVFKLQINAAIILLWSIENQFHGINRLKYYDVTMVLNAVHYNHSIAVFKIPAIFPQFQ